MDPTNIAQLAAAICISLCSIGASYAIKACSPALAVVTEERPDLSSKLLITIILGEALAIYGLLISFMIISNISEIETDTQAYSMLMASITMGVTSIAAGIGIAYCGPSLMSAVLVKEESFSTNILGLILSEALAIYGLLISFMLIG